jgi:hypothetical protein
MYVPNYTEDSYRIFKEINAIRQGGDLKNSMNLDILWTQYLYLKFFAVISDNNDWTCVITDLLEVTLCFMIYSRQCKKAKLNIRSSMNGGLVFLETWDYYLASSNLHYLLPGAAFLLILHMDLVENKNTLLCMLGYICLVFFHPAMSILLVLRLIVLVSKKDIITMIACVLLLAQRNFINLAGTIISMIPGRIAERVNYKYTTIVAAYLTKDITYARMAVKLPLALCCAGIIWCFYLFYREKYPYFKKYILFGLLLMSMSLGASYNYDLFNRHAMIGYMFFVPFYCILRKDKSVETSRRRYLVIEGTLRATELMCAVHLIYLLKVQFTHFNMSIFLT